MQLNLEKKKLPSEANLRLIANLCIALANKQSALEDKTVAPWKADTTYQKDVSYVSYNGYLWLCTITNTDSEFNEAHWQKLSDNITELSKDDIAALINLTPEQVTALQTLIDDDTITATKTYSSSKIYAAINDAIAECKDDTLKQIAKKVSGAYKIASSTSDVISTDYIYLISNGNTYDLYVLVGNTPTKVGDTNIDLSDYLKSVDAESTYLKKTDAEGTYAKITDMDKKVDKINIISNPSASSTNEQIVGAAKYYNDITNLLLKLIKNSNPYVAIDSPVSSNDFITRLYAGMEYLALQKRDSTNTSIIDNMSIAQFGVGFAYTIVNADDDLNDFTINSFLTVGANAVNAPYTGANFMGISIAFADNPSYAVQVLFDANENEGTTYNRTIYIRHCYNNVWSNWFTITSSKAQETIVGINEFIDLNVSGVVFYRVKNGICYVQIWPVKSTVTGYAIELCSIPKPLQADCGNAIVNANGDGSNVGFAFASISSSKLLCHFYQANTDGYGSFSYPVAES